MNLPLPPSPTAAEARLLREHPWVALENPQEVEGWMDVLDRELQSLLAEKHAIGPGVCFTLTHGGEVYMHTNGDGDVLLDVTPEADWIAPVICASTRQDAPRGQIWVLPQHAMIELILGMSTLIASSRLVLRHEFRQAKR